MSCPHNVSDKFLGEATEELCDPTDSVVCDPTCAGRLLDQENEESIHPSSAISNPLPEIPEEECCNGCCADDEENRCAQHAESAGEEEIAQAEEKPEEESNEVQEVDESCPDPPPSITVEDEECAPVEECELIVKESDENGNEDIEDRNVRKGVDDEEGEESIELEVQYQTEEAAEGDGEDEITRCRNCEALNTMIHHLKSVGKSFR